MSNPKVNGSLFPSLTSPYHRHNAALSRGLSLCCRPFGFRSTCFFGGPGESLLCVFFLFTDGFSLTLSFWLRCVFSSWRPLTGRAVVHRASVLSWPCGFSSPTPLMLAAADGHAAFTGLRRASGRFCATTIRCRSSSLRRYLLRPP